MDNRTELDKIIEILNETLLKLKRLRQDCNTETSEHQVLLNQITQLNKDVAELKGAIL